MSSSNKDLVNIVDGLVEAKINRMNEDKKYPKALNKFYKILLTIFATLILTSIYCQFFRTPYISETVSYHNTPSFPFIDFKIISNINFTRDFNPFYLIIFEYKNGTKITKTFSSDVNVVSWVLGVVPLTINEGDDLFIFIKVDEKYIKQLNAQGFTLWNRVYTLTSNNEIEVRFQIKQMENRSSQGQESKYVNLMETCFQENIWRQI